MNYENRIEKVKAKLIIEQPYFGTIASTLKPKLNEDLKTFQTSPGVFEYNDDFISSQSDEQLAFILTNAAMHHALSYQFRKENRLLWLWKMAQNHAINSLLVNNGMSLPNDIEIEERFINLSAEAIYKILENEIDEEKHTPKDVEKFKYEEEFKDQQLDDQIKELTKQITQKAKLYGDLPLGIEILIKEIFDGAISWEEELYEMIEHSVKFDYSLLPPNKRYLAQGIALPSLSGTIVKLVIAVDSSGSINENLLTRFMSEVQSIMNSFENFEIDLLICDAKVHEHYILQAGDTLEYKIKGGGGTNFANTFLYIQENISNVNLLLYFTDGIGTFPDEFYDFDTVWVLTQEDTQIPFGRKIILQA